MRPVRDNRHGSAGGSSRLSHRRIRLLLLVGAVAVLLVGSLPSSCRVEGFQAPLLQRFRAPSSTHPSFSSSLSASNANELVPLRPGSSVALVTPFDRQTGNVDVPGLKRLLQYHLDAGTVNLCILGTTGEASLLNMDERQLILQTAVELVKGRMCLLVGTGTINPQSVRAMTQQAIDLGCDASLVVTPYYVKPPQRGLIQHMLFAADLGLPVVMYNVPGRTGVNMLDDGLAVAAQHPLVAGVKDATGDLARLSRLQQLVQEKSNGNDVEGGFLYYSGDDATSLDYVLQGGDGCISVTANVAASDMATMMEQALAGRDDAARAINDRLGLLHQRLFLESNPIPVKWAVQQLGLIDSSQCRPPLDQFDEATFGAQLREALRQGNLLSE